MNIPQHNSIGVALGKFLVKEVERGDGEEPRHNVHPTDPRGRVSVGEYAVPDRLHVRVGAVALLVVYDHSAFCLRLSVALRRTGMGCPLRHKPPLSVLFMPLSIRPSPMPATGQKYKNIGLPLSVFPLVQTFFPSHAALPKNNAGAAARGSNTGV